MIVGDAIRYLEDSKRQGRHFDFIFGDLTDVPINTDHNCKETGMMNDDTKTLFHSCYWQQNFRSLPFSQLIQPGTFFVAFSV